MVIVGGAFTVNPAERDAFIASRVEGMELSRAEPGCLEYVMAADPLDPGRVVLFERWESQAALDTHLAVQRPAPPAGSPAPTGASIKIYDVAGERTLA